MSVNVEARSTPEIEVPSITSLLRKRCEDSVKALRDRIFTRLDEKFEDLEVSPLVLDRILDFRDLVLLLTKYKSCFSIQESESQFILKLDRAKLLSLGLPENLPELLEYGSEIGIPPVAHMRIAWSAFLREDVSQLATVKE